jgi:hypothetical protein
MSPPNIQAINFYMNVEKIKGTEGDDRVIITFNGKVGGQSSNVYIKRVWQPVHQCNINP